MRHGQTLFTYLHLAALRSCPEAARRGHHLDAYETVEGPRTGAYRVGPMSRSLGGLRAQVGAYHLMRTPWWRACLMGGVPGVERRRWWSSARDRRIQRRPGCHRKGCAITC